MEIIWQFSTDFRHVPVQDNIVADDLPRANSVTTPLDYYALASLQDEAAELQDILKHGSALRLERQDIPETVVAIYCDTSSPQQW